MSGAHILKSELEHGQYYSGECRNASIARWNADEQRFFYWRFKFGDWFVDTIKAPEDEAVFDVFYALAVITPEREIPLEE